MLTIAQIKTELQSYRPKKLEKYLQRQAAVAMLLTPGEVSPEILFVRRAEYEGDPWSGDVAFPGGSLEARDAGLRQAAEREVWEEIGLRLQPQQYLGQLDDLGGAYLPIQISCFVYQLTTKPRLRLNGEVAAGFWVPLTQLLSRERRQLSNITYRGTSHTHPIIKLDGYCDHFLWGISYRLLESFFSLVGGKTPPQA
ncbi:MAG: CoA pyrophosphatase, partial [Deltaproteobacteria bacterium]|nr:CoA pyrophosphatase [Deltaproteobacteria bacterium]